jgi:hypothetical protein
MKSSDPPRFRWYHIAPGCLIIALFVAECFLFVSNRTGWFGFDEWKGWTSLMATALAGAVILLGVIWIGMLSIRLVRFRFRVWLLVAFVVPIAAGIAADMFVPELRSALAQRQAVDVVRNVGHVGYDNRDKNFLIDGQVPGTWWLVTLLGEDFFVRATSISLDADRVTKAELDQLDHLPHLRQLGVAGSPLSEDVLQRLKSLPQLQELDLSGTGLTDAELEPLRTLQQLTILQLDGTQVSDAGLQSLIGMTHLQRLGLRDTQVTDVGLESLTGFSMLIHLDLSGTRVTSDGAAKLRRALPKCIIVH